MSHLHLSFFSAFALSSLGLAFYQTHLISALLCLESMMLSMYIALSTWSIKTQTPSPTLMPILMLAFSASTQIHGSHHLHNLNLLQC